MHTKKNKKKNNQDTDTNIENIFYMLNNYDQNVKSS